MFGNELLVIAVTFDTTYIVKLMEKNSKNDQSQLTSTEVIDYQLVSRFEPKGDQPEAIKQMVEGINRGDKHQTLLGVTGSGKTFSIANVIAQTNRPALVISHIRHWQPSFTAN